MTIQTFYKLWAMTYFEVIDYLLNKYGPVKYAYTNNTRNNGKTRGLYVHHIEEYRLAALSTSWAKKAYPQYQKPECLCFCNLLEHFLLHLIIARDHLKEKAVSAGGLGQYIYPDLHQFFIRKKCKPNIAKTYYDVIAPYTDTFLLLQKEYLNLKTALEGCINETYFSDGTPDNKRFWTPDQDAILIANYETLGAERVQQLLDEDFEKKYPGSLTTNGKFCRHIRSIPAIFNRAFIKGLGEKDTYIPWTQREDKILTKYYKAEGEKCFSRLKGRTYNACRTRARDLGLKTVRNIAWTPEEDEVIQRLYIKDTWRAVQKELPNRSKNSIIKRAKYILGDKLKIGKSVKCVETGEVFSSLASAAKFACISHSGISECLYGTQQTAGGYHWERVY